MLAKYRQRRSKTNFDASKREPNFQCHNTCFRTVWRSRSSSRYFPYRTTPLVRGLCVQKVLLLRSIIVGGCWVAKTYGWDVYRCHTLCVAKSRFLDLVALLNNIQALISQPHLGRMLSYHTWNLFTRFMGRNPGLRSKEQVLPVTTLAACSSLSNQHGRPSPFLVTSTMVLSI